MINNINAGIGGDTEGSNKYEKEHGVGKDLQEALIAIHFLPLGVAGDKYSDEQLVFSRGEARMLGVGQQCIHCGVEIRGL